MLIKAAKEAGTNVLEAIDYLDDGTPICLKVTIDSEKGDAVFDFEGTGAEVRGNLNAPIAVVHSAIIYWYGIHSRDEPSSLSACVRWSIRTSP